VFALQAILRMQNIRNNNYASQTKFQIKIQGKAQKSFEQHFVESKMLGVYYSASVIRNTHRNATESVITLNVLHHNSAAEQARNLPNSYSLGHHPDGLLLREHVDFMLARMRENSARMCHVMQT
jgi:hypothetical protein